MQLLQSIAWQFNLRQVRCMKQDKATVVTAVFETVCRQKQLWHNHDCRLWKCNIIAKIGCFLQACLVDERSTTLHHDSKSGWQPQSTYHIQNVCIVWTVASKNKLQQWQTYLPKSNSLAKIVRDARFFTTVFKHSRNFMDQWWYNLVSIFFFPAVHTSAQSTSYSCLFEKHMKKWDVKIWQNWLKNCVFSTFQTPKKNPTWT